MSTPAAPPGSNKSSTLEVAQDEARIAEKPRLLLSLCNHALTGAAAALLLSVVELVDLSFRLTAVFQSFPEGAVFCAYFSLNVAGGLVIGLLVGLFAHTASLLKRTGQKIMERGHQARLIHKLIAGAGVSAFSAFLLNQQPQVRGYAVGIIREAEKIESLTVPLLNHERSTSYLILFVIVIACSLVWMATHALRHASPRMRARWIVSLVVLIASAYYVDSRFETQQYGGSIHRSMFLLNTALTMSLIGTLFSRPRTRSFWPAIGSPIRKVALLGMAILLVLAGEVREAK
ncbi:MAG: hypothetical protein AABN33_26270 [Acidobacteriota bacterium]